jgi:homoserine dehydrogenase
MLADVALVGFGHVGRRFATLMSERRERLAQDFDLDARIVGISTGRHGAAWSASGLDVERAVAGVESGQSLAGLDGSAAASGSFDVIARLGQSPADLRVVVETTVLDIRSGRPAIDHVRAGIAAGCHVVTANKGPAAFAFADLRDAADARGVSFLFEGAVMDGIPIFNLVRETLPVVEVLGFRGVVNATTNHILSALEDGDEFAPALARMQHLGIAEADPSLDVDGWDAAAKAAALANVLMGARITPHAVHRTGLNDASAGAARRAMERGRRLRLVASADRTDDGAVRAAVAPVELPADDLLAGLRGQANALILRTDLLGEIAICQMDGSLTQTAYALVSDLVTIRKRAAREAPPRQIL